MRDPAWGLWEILLVIVAYVASLFICGLAWYSLLKGFANQQGQSFPLNIAASPLFFVPMQTAAYFMTFVFMRMHITLRSQQDFWKAIRWRMPALEPGIAYALTGVILAILVQFSSAVLPMPKSVPMQEFFRDPRSAYMMAAFGVLMAPIAEEIFFRGLVFPVLARHMGAAAAIIVTAATFALLHQGQLARAWAPLLLLFLVGLVLTIIRARSNSVAASWIMHLSYNGTLFGLMYYFTNGFRNLSR